MVSIQTQRLKYVVSDWLTTSIAFVLFNISRFYILNLPSLGISSVGKFLMMNHVVAEQIVIPVASLGLYWLTGFYNNPFQRSRLKDFMTTLASAAIATLLIWLLLLVNDLVAVRALNYSLMLLLFAYLFICVWVGRMIIASREVYHTLKKQWKFKTVIVGTSDTAVKLTLQLKKSLRKFGYDISAYCQIDGEECKVAKDKVIPLSELPEFCKSSSVSQIILAPQDFNEQTILTLLNSLYSLGLPVKIVPDKLSLITSGIKLQDIYAEPFVDITSPSMSESTRNMKRVIDVLCSAFALIMLSPLMAVVAILIKRDSKGPVIFKQERIGFRQKPFMIRKFRTMRVDAEKDGPQLAQSDDARITKIGKTLRKYRLDELPQFWNVLIGDMSLVGPRPERSYFIRKILEREPYYALLQQVRPGITSWGMVKYGYASTIEEMVMRMRYDLIYLSNMSISVDIKILIHTIKTVVKGLGK